MVGPIFLANDTVAAVRAKLPRSFRSCIGSEFQLFPHFRLSHAVLKNDHISSLGVRQHVEIEYERISSHRSHVARMARAVPLNSNTKLSMLSTESLLTTPTLFLPHRAAIAFTHHGISSLHSSRQQHHYNAPAQETPHRRRCERKRSPKRKAGDRPQRMLCLRRGRREEPVSQGSTRHDGGYRAARVGCLLQMLAAAPPGGGREQGS